MVACANMGLIALVTDTGKANSTRLRLVQFEASPVPVISANIIAPEELSTD